MKIWYEHYRTKERLYVEGEGRGHLRGVLHLLSAVANFFTDALIVQDKAGKALNHSHEIIVFVNESFQEGVVELTGRTLVEPIVVSEEEVGHGVVIRFVLRIPSELIYTT